MIIFSVNDLNHSDHNFANILKNSLPCSSYNITDINEILKTFGIIYYSIKHSDPTCGWPGHMTKPLA